MYWSRSSKDDGDVAGLLLDEGQWTSATSRAAAKHHHKTSSIKSLHTERRSSLLISFPASDSGRYTRCASWLFDGTDTYLQRLIVYVFGDGASKLHVDLSNPSSLYVTPWPTVFDACSITETVASILCENVSYLYTATKTCNDTFKIFYKILYFVHVKSWLHFFTVENAQIASSVTTVYISSQFLWSTRLHVHVHVPLSALHAGSQTCRHL